MLAYSKPGETLRNLAFQNLSSNGTFGQHSQMSYPIRHQTNHS